MCVYVCVTCFLPLVNRPETTPSEGLSGIKGGETFDRSYVCSLGSSVQTRSVETVKGFLDL